MKKELEVARPKVPSLKNPKKKKEDPQDMDISDKEKSDNNKEDVKKDADLLTLEDIKEQIGNIDKAVATKEPRFMSRALRAMVSLRRKLNPNVIRRAVQQFVATQALPNGPAGLLDFLEEPMETETPAVRPKSAKPLLPETEIYLHLLLLLYLLDKKQYKQAVTCSDTLMEKVVVHNRRTLDMLAAKCYFYYARTYELTKQVDRIRQFLHARLRTCTLRSDFEGTATLLNLLLRFLHARLRTCTLRSDFEGTATLLNLLLRNYLLFNLYDQADKLVSKSTFPDSASNNEWARFLYYLGRIKAIQLEYSEAHRNLLQAIRKAPQHTAAGFKQTVQKMLITVELLMGDIPDRAVFRQPTMRKTLQPYFQITQAVRTGNLALFNKTLENYGSRFQAEDTYTLIIRLRHNVIKTGVRMINLSYSRISLMDIASKLLLDSPEDAEYIVAKAIRDGVIEATIDHEQGYVKSKENVDIYSTREPMAAFHQRISFCLDIHNSSVKAMRFPPKSYNKDLESVEERREREQQEMESAKEIADDDFDGFP